MYLSGLRARRAELESQVVEILKRGIARGTTSHDDRQAVIALQQEISGIKKTLAAITA